MAGVTGAFGTKKHAYIVQRLLIVMITSLWQHHLELCRSNGSVASLMSLVRSAISLGMARRREAARIRQDRPFKGRQFTAEVILWAVRWYLMFPISYRDLELMLLDPKVEVDHITLFRWIQAYAAELDKRIRPHLRMSNGSWRVDETYLLVARFRPGWIYW